MARKFFMISVALLLLIAMGASAADKQKSSPQTKEMNKTNSPESALTLVKLSHFTDLWHDATLKGQQSKVIQLESEILTMIRDDIEASHSFIEGQKKALKDGTVIKLMSYIDNEEDIAEFELLLKVKKRLAGSISKSSAFSNKYRLFGDYREILRREVDLTRFDLVAESDEYDE